MKQRHMTKSAYDIHLTTMETADKFQPVLWTNPLFMTEAAKVYDLEPKLLLAYKGEFLAAALPIYEKRRIGSVSLVINPSSYYQELQIWHQEETPAPRRLLDELQITSAMALYLKEHYRNIAFNLTPGHVDVRGFTWNGLKALPFYTFTHQLDQELSPIRDEREKLRRAEARGYQWHRGLDVEAFLTLNEALEQRKNRAIVLHPKRMRGYIENLHAAGLLRQYNVSRDGVIKSSNLLLTDGGEESFTILRASDRSEMRYGVSAWHTQQLVNDLKAQHCMLDLCGGNTPDVARFKAALGLQLKVFYRITN